MRYEITGLATDHAELPEIQKAVAASGGKRVNARHAYGWSNQPMVCTFAADSDDQADEICRKAVVAIWGNASGIYSLHAWQYGPGAMKYRSAGQ